MSAFCLFEEDKSNQSFDACRSCFTAQRGVHKEMTKMCIDSSLRYLLFAVGASFPVTREDMIPGSRGQLEFDKTGNDGRVEALRRHAARYSVCTGT